MNTKEEKIGQQERIAMKELIITRDWECEGALRMENARTIDTYKRIKEKRTVEKPLSDYEMFVAFDDTRFQEGLKEIGKSIKEVYSLGAGVYGTPEGWERYCRDTAKSEKDIKKYCDPQEVYCYEYNNHECMFAWDGDVEAVRCVINLFGVRAAKKLKYRFSDYRTVDEIRAMKN